MPWIPLVTKERPTSKRSERVAVRRSTTPTRSGSTTAVAKLHERHFVSAAVYQRILDAFEITGVVELTALIGYYAMVAMALDADQFPLPAGITPPLPPR